MGRIADALRRAEQERKRAADAGRGVQASAAPPRTPLEHREEHAPRPTPMSSIPALLETDTDEPIALVDGLSESLVPYYERSSLVAEQYRALRTRLLSQNPQYDHRVLVITSAVPKEGKSVTTLNLGSTFAEVRHLRTLVVDADFRRSSLAQMLNQPEGPGLADVLNGTARYEDVIRKTPIPNLLFVPAGSTQGRSAAELLASEDTKKIFKRFHNDFHYTLVDTPPATTVTDVGIIGQMCSGVVMVVRLQKTHEAVARRAVRLLQVNNINILGALVVGRDSAAARYGY